MVIVISTRQVNAAGNDVGGIICSICEKLSQSSLWCRGGLSDVVVATVRCLAAEGVREIRPQDPVRPCRAPARQIETGTGAANRNGRLPIKRLWLRRLFWLRRPAAICIRRFLAPPHPSPPSCRLFLSGPRVTNMGINGKTLIWQNADFRRRHTGRIGLWCRSLRQRRLARVRWRECTRLWPCGGISKNSRSPGAGSCLLPSAASGRQARRGMPWRTLAANS